MTSSKEGDGAAAADTPATPHPSASRSDVTTPMRSQQVAPIPGSGSSTRRVTRSMAKTQPDMAFDLTPGSTTRLQDRLRSAPSTFGGQGGTSNLEEARTIVYGGGHPEGADEANDGNDEPNEEEESVVAAPPLRLFFTRSRSRPGGKNIHLRLGHQSSKRKKGGKATARESTPSYATVSTAGDGERSCKRRKLDEAPRKLPLRRSARLAKPLTEFHKFSALPIELQMMVWEAAIEPRVVYLRNLYILPVHLPRPTPTIPTKIPPWFLACRLALKVAKLHYQPMFYMRRQPSDRRVVRQPIDPMRDIVLFEPCCHGCRARHCASRSYPGDRAGDRAAVRMLAVQTDSPHLLPSVPPCWVSIAETWPAVHTLYLLKTAVRGDDRREKALLRAEEGLYEERLRVRFDAWKKGPGKDSPLQHLEFALVAEKEPGVLRAEDRYKAIEGRKSDLPEDIILG